MRNRSYDVTIVVLTYNRWDCLRVMLAELRAIADLVHEVIVVDNHSTDGTADLLSRDFPEFVHVRTERNLGVSARNLGIARATGATIITLDDDLLGLSPESLALVESEFAAHPELGALNFRVIDYYTRRVCNWVHHRNSTDSDQRFLSYEITEGAVAFRREAFVRSGGYYPRYFIGHEGPDLAFRMMNSGFTVEYDGRVSVLHKHEESTRTTWRFYYFDTRNHIWLVVRNMPLGYGIWFLVRGLGAMAAYSLRDGYFPWFAAGVHDAMVDLPAVIRTREVWTHRTLDLCRDIDRHRPGFWTLVRQRLFRAGFRLDT
ncbi:MAG: glycosyltransferase [Betaproteobacteria bacterium]|nr:glycosyltransferase [Betaproteobacteria bacterium]